MNLKVVFLAVLSSFFFSSVLCAANETIYPSGKRAEYFYVFGPDGDPAFGKDDSRLELMIDIPASEAGEQWSLAIFDPDTGGYTDHLVGPAYGNTKVEFTIKGHKELVQQTFGSEESVDGKWISFGPYAIDAGESVGNVFRFKFIAKAKRGNDQNLFKVKVIAASAELWAEELTLTSASKTGAGIFLYPELRVGNDEIIAENLNLDRGALSLVVDPATGKSYQINHVSSPEWQTMKLLLGDGQARRLNYMIKPTLRSYRNAGVRFKGKGSEPLRIYFDKGNFELEPKKTIEPDPPVPAQTSETSSAHVPAGPPSSISKCNQFTFDASDSYDLENKKITYEWDFGDGHVSDQPVISHVFEKSGTYRVTLKVSNNSGLHCETAVSTQDVVVNMPPVASFSLPDANCTTDVVQFDASQTVANGKAADELKYYWDFGDGNRAEGMKAEHRYARGGKYRVTLTVDDGSGGDCAVGRMQKEIFINAPPVAKAFLEDQGDGASVRFDGTGSYDPDNDEIRYEWDFGDGEIRTYAQGLYKYGSAGSYPVKLTVKDDKGLECSEATLDLTANIRALPKPQIVDKKYYDKKYFDKSRKYTKYNGK